MAGSHIDKVWIDESALIPAPPQRPLEHRILSLTKPQLEAIRYLLACPCSPYEPDARLIERVEAAIASFAT